MQDNSPWHVPVGREGFTIGRSSSCQLILNGVSVSRYHGEIAFKEEEPYIRDLGSRNGTFVNGCRVAEERHLEEGDILSFGKAEFVLRRGEEEEPVDEVTLIDEGRGGKPDFGETYGLSGREKEVLFLLVKGRSTKEIGQKLFISPGTVKNHVLKIYAKTGAHSRIELSTLYAEF